MISTPTQGGHGLDPEHEPQAASSAFYANRHCESAWQFGLVCPMARHLARLERTRIGIYRTSWHQTVLPEMPATTLEISKLHCQPSRQPLVETCPSVHDGTKTKIGRARNKWDSQIQTNCRWKCLGEWSTTAMLTDVWLTHIHSLLLKFRRRNSES